MKRLILSALALSMLAIPSVGAQAAPFNPGQNVTQSNVQLVAQKQVVRKRVVVKKHGDVRKKVVVRKSQYHRGQRYSGWKRHQAIRDYNRYGLHRPARGQEWIRVGNDYLLVGITSGIIASLIAGQ